jgi:hypothetical protein
MRFSSLALSVIVIDATASSTAALGMPVADMDTFRLVPGAHPATVAPAAEKITPCRDATGAMHNGTQRVDADGLSTAHIVWTREAAVQKAAAEIMDAPTAQSFMKRIDTETVSLQHARVRSSLCLG